MSKKKKVKEVEISAEKQEIKKYNEVVFSSAKKYLYGLIGIVVVLGISLSTLAYYNFI